MKHIPEGIEGDKVTLDQEELARQRNHDLFIQALEKAMFGTFYQQTSDRAHEYRSLYDIPYIF